jgi:hypothetical protein
MFSALEGHRLSGPFHQKRILRLRDFLTGYIEGRIRAGEFREVDPRLAARAFMGMVVDHLVVKHVLGQKELYPQPADEVAATFVSIFLGGMRSTASTSAPEPRTPAAIRENSALAKTGTVKAGSAKSGRTSSGGGSRAKPSPAKNKPTARKRHG